VRTGGLAQASNRRSEGRRQPPGGNGTTGPLFPVGHRSDWNSTAIVCSPICRFW